MRVNRRPLAGLNGALTSTTGPEIITYENATAGCYPGLAFLVPLGLTILVILGLLWAGVRRLPKLPKRHVEVSE